VNTSAILQDGAKSHWTLKTSHYTLAHNFAKRWSIYTLNLSLGFFVKYLASFTEKRPVLHHTYTTILRPFFRDHPGEPVPEENVWTLWCKGRLTEADTLTIRLDATPSELTSAHQLHHPPIFFGPDALPAAQPTVSNCLHSQLQHVLLR